MSALAAIAAAMRVFSADFCADQLVLALAAPKDIAALSPDAARDFSFMRAEAGGLPRARPDAEEAFSRKADIVLRFWGGDPARLDRLGVRTVTLGYAPDFGAVRSIVETAADALGRQAQGEALVAAMDARLAAIAARGQTGLRALYVTPGGVTAGKGTMIDAIFAAAGVVNIAAEDGAAGWPALPLERLVAAPPDLIIAGFFDGASVNADNWSAARHPGFARAFSQTRVIRLPADLISCPGFFSVDAAEFIRHAIDEAGDAR